MTDVARPPRVSVVVPALRSGATLPACLDAVLGQGEVVDEVVVACPPDDVDTREALADVDDPRVRVVDNPSGRTPDALNAAIAASSGDVVVRVDAHAVVPPGYVARAVAELRRTGAANVGGRQVPTADAGFARAVAVAMRSPLGAGGAAYRTGSEPGEVDTVYLGTFDRAVLEAVGGYDPRMTRNQDAELNLRLRAAGHRVWFDPGLEVAYRPRGSVAALWRQYVQYGRWRRVTARLHPGSLRPRQLAAPALVIGGAVAIVASLLLATPLPMVVGAVSYLVLLIAGAAAAGPARDVPGVVLALATMHLAWGLGFLIGPPRSARPSRDDRVSREL